EYDNFYLVTVYTPNSQRELTRLQYRLCWEEDFRMYLKKLDAQKPVIVCGDMNVAHREIDLKNPKTNTNNAGFTPQERAAMTKLLSEGFVDTFRYLYPDVTGAYSWWSYMFSARAKNVGWRIDYFLVSERIKDRITAAAIHSDVMGSDHCPVVLEIDL
ncbi:MAG: exodeoxyribonuclease III, partial [Clostridia bacterium]|nr:exodeoxyribonuclease III [Clostridia bacterium]